MSAAGTEAAAPDGSIARRKSPRDTLLVFEIRDRISKPDIEWMAGISDRAFDLHGEVDMLLIMTNYEGTHLGARFDADAASAQARALSHVRRYAVVGAPAWASAMIELSGKVTPVDTKTFKLEEEQAAWAWVNEGRPG